MAEWVAQFQLRAVIYSLSSLPFGNLKDGFGDRQVALKIHRHMLLGFHSRGMQEDSLGNGDTGLLASKTNGSVESRQESCLLLGFLS